MRGRGGMLQHVGEQVPLYRVPHCPVVGLQSFGRGAWVPWRVEMVGHRDGQKFPRWLDVAD